MSPEEIKAIGLDTTCCSVVALDENVGAIDMTQASAAVKMRTLLWDLL